MNFHTLSVDVLRLCLWLVLLTAIFVPLERFFSIRRQPLRRRETLADLGLYFLNSLAPAVLLGLPMSLVAVAAQYVMPAGFGAAVGGLPLIVKLLLSMVIGDMGFYWGHRLSHRFAWLWRFHAVHHSAEHLYFLVNTKAHPVDIVFTRLVGLTPLYVIGLAGPGAAGSAAPVAVIIVSTLWGFFIHANLRWRIGPFEWLVATPAFHHWHHTRADHINRNYSPTLPFIDKLFGTYYLPEHWPADYGIDEAMPASFSGQLLAPLLPPKKRIAEPAPANVTTPNTIPH
jgi:sterol desaturase/sphingolipid hydroxylase (fatty acid hydroxylase superfamily)